MKLLSKLYTKQFIEAVGRCSMYLSTAMVEWHHSTRNHFITKGTMHTVGLTSEKHNLC